MTDLSKEKGQEPVPQWAFTGFNLHRNTGRVYICVCVYVYICVCIYIDM